MRTRIVTFAVAALVLAWVWWAIPAGSPPVYDGLCLSSPYRSLHPPPGVSSVPPHGVTKDEHVSGGDIQTTQLSTDEPNQPQAQLIIASGTLRIPAGATSVRLSITPVDPPAVLPADGTIDGNVYRFAATSDAGPVGTTGTTKATVLLVGTSANNPHAVLEHFDGSAWHQVPTVTIGCAGSFATSTTELGDFAVVTLGAPATPNPAAPAPAGPSAWVLAAGVVVLVAIAAATTVWMRRRR